MRALPPSSAAVPAPTSAPPLVADATNLPAPHERAFEVPLPSPAASGTPTSADVAPRPRVVQLLSPTPPSPTTPHARPKSRLTFAPPEAPSPAAAPSPQPVLPLSREVSHAMAPMLEHARQLSVPAPSTEPNTSAPVQNTFNVSVQVGTDNAATGMDRRTLEDALVDILRESARRHGLEV
ncbi:hypothetical protein [Myxococcus sp. AB025B]|uniref:hypothetical protein n=1 Tax=Myxococcus sp. AB025B TaxID=2562794 RepID=UPI0011444CC8|nr:hypothetical protein [Myxococcus sp. AB025B]